MTADVFVLYLDTSLCFVVTRFLLQVKRALNLVQMMRSEGIAPTEFTYNVVFRLCGLGGSWAMGLELMSMMEVSFFPFLSFEGKNMRFIIRVVG